jgi:hypothetical protein
MNWYIWIGVTALAACVCSTSALADTASCNGKRGWQRDIVREAVHDWFRGAPRPDSLVELVQAEHGIAACGSRGGLPRGLHTPTLPRGMELDRLGAALLANELEWSGVMPRPEAGLAGEYFRVRGPQPLVGDAE